MILDIPGLSLHDSAYFVLSANGSRLPLRPTGQVYVNFSLFALITYEC
jgi:hypothetical protein